MRLNIKNMIIRTLVEGHFCLRSMALRSATGVAAAMLLAAGVASAQTYPARTIRVVSGAAGGAADIGARIIANGISGPLGQQIIIDNRGGGTVPADLVSKAPADGYTLLYASSGMWLAPFLRDKLSYDPVKDFAPVTLATTAPNVLVVHPSVKANSVQELIALLKANPGRLNYAASNIGGAAHLAGELFKSMAGVDIVTIPYKGGGPANLALISGEVQLMFATAGGVLPFIKAGKVRALAVSTPKPTPLFPDLPTIAAAGGLQGYEIRSSNGLLAPAKTPEPIVRRLYQEIAQFMKQPAIQKRFFDEGADALASTPEEFAAVIRSDMTVLGKVIKDAGIREE